jgi:hypothetical protein
LSFFGLRGKIVPASPVYSDKSPDAVRRLKGGAVEENKEPTTSKEEDVEAHGYVERPVGEQPSAEANTEEPDVEGHGFVEKPVAEKPVAE